MVVRPVKEHAGFYRGEWARSWGAFPGEARYGSRTRSCLTRVTSWSFFSDGVTEAFNADWEGIWRRPAAHRLRDRAHRDLAPVELLDRVAAAIKAFVSKIDSER